MVIVRNISMKLLNVFVLLLCLNSFAKAQETITVVTEHWPPYQVVENGISTDGFATMVVKAMLEEAGTPKTIRGFNWARAYKMALERPNVMIFGLFRSKDREHKFKWIGKLIRQVNGIWYLSDHKDFQIKQLNDAKRYRFAVPREDIRHQFLLNQGFEQDNNITIVRDHKQAVSLLFLRRTDLVLSDKRNIRLTANLAGFDPTLLRQVPNVEVHLGDLFIACSLKTPDSVVKKYQDAYQRILLNGTIEKLKQQYIPGHKY